MNPNELTQEEKQFISDETGIPIDQLDFSKLTADDLETLFEQEQVIAPPQPQPRTAGQILMDPIVAATNNLLLGNIPALAKTLGGKEAGEKAAARIAEAESTPLGTAGGLTGTAATMALPGPGITRMEQAITKAPALVRLAARLGVGAGTGAGYGMLTAPEGEDSVEKRLSQAKTGALIGAPLGTTPAALDAVSKFMYKRGLDPLNLALELEGFKPVGDEFMKKGFSGTLKQVHEQYKKSLDPVFKKRAEILNKVTRTISPEVTAKFIGKEIPEPTSRPLQMDPLSAMKNFVESIRMFNQGSNKPKRLAISDVDAVAQDMGAAARAGFVPTSIGEKLNYDKKQLANTAMRASKLRELMVKLGSPEDIDEFKKVQKEIGRANQIFPDLGPQSIRESYKKQFTPSDIMWASNPYTAPYAATREAAEMAYSPWFLTNIGKYMQKGKSANFTPMSVPKQKDESNEGN